MLSLSSSHGMTEYRVYTTVSETVVASFAMKRSTPTPESSYILCNVNYIRKLTHLSFAICGYIYTWFKFVSQIPGQWEQIFNVSFPAELQVDAEWRRTSLCVRGVACLSRILHSYTALQYATSHSLRHSHPPLSVESVMRICNSLLSSRCYTSYLHIPINANRGCILTKLERNTQFAF